MHPTKQYIHELHIMSMLRVPIAITLVEIASPIALDWGTISYATMAIMMIMKVTASTEMSG
jgi:hypothetical protein